MHRWIRSSSGVWFAFFYDPSTRRWTSPDTSMVFTHDYLNTSVPFISYDDFHQDRNNMRPAETRGPRSANTLGRSTNHILKGPTAIETRVYCNNCIGVYSLHDNDRCPLCKSLEYKLRADGLDIYTNRAADVTLGNSENAVRDRFIAVDEPMSDNRWHIMDNSNQIRSTGPGITTNTAGTNQPTQIRNFAGASFTAPTSTRTRGTIEAWGGGGGSGGGRLSSAGSVGGSDRMTAAGFAETLSSTLGMDPREAQIRRDEAREANDDGPVIVPSVF